MTDQVTTASGAKRDLTIKDYMAGKEIQKRISEMLGDRASEFVTSVISIAGTDPKIMKCEPRSLFNACLAAAAMRLPISKELAMAHIIPYENNKLGITEAQIQLGWRAYVQMAQRSGEYKTIAAAPVYNGQLVSSDPLRGNVYDFSPEAKISNDILGYASLFVLRNGFEKDLFMTMDEIEAHALRYSKAYAYDKKSKYQNSPWSTNFDAMAKKTVLKLLIKNFGVMSIDMQKAVQVDQAVIKDDNKFDYIDGEEASTLENEKNTTDEMDAIIEAQTVDDLEAEGANNAMVEAAPEPAPIRETVKERVAKAGWNPKSQPSFLEDDKIEIKKR